MEFNRFVDETSAAADRLEPQAFALQIMRALAIPRNAHTSAEAAPLLGDDLPVRAWWFSDGLHIVKTHPDFARLLGARIDRIGSLSADEAQGRIKPFLSGNDQRIRFLGPGYLVAPEVLKQIGAIDDTASVPLTLTLADRKTETIELQATGNGDPGDERKAGMNRGYSVLIPDDTGLPGRWPHVLDHVAERSPLYSSRGDVQSRFLDASKKQLYIRIDEVNSVDETPLLDKFARLFGEKILPVRPRHVVVDLRLNKGGDFFNTILFSQGLPRLLPPNGRVFVLVSRATFSAGITTAGMLEAADPDRVVLVGEPMGDGGRFWSEGKKIELPHSKIKARYSPQFHDYEAGCTDLSKCYWAAVAFGPRGISLAPETVDVRFSDYAAGRDPVLEAALRQMGGR